jgi:hypothetical protein
MLQKVLKNPYKIRVFWRGPAANQTYHLCYDYVTIMTDHSNFTEIYRRVDLTDISDISAL